MAKQTCENCAGQGSTDMGATLCSLCHGVGVVLSPTPSGTPAPSATSGPAEVSEADHKAVERIAGNTYGTELQPGGRWSYVRVPDHEWSIVLRVAAARVRAPEPACLDAAKGEAVAALREVCGCFEAAITEGLVDRLAEDPDNESGSLWDLVRRRLMPAYEAAVQALAVPTFASAPAPDARGMARAVEIVKSLRENWHKLWLANDGPRTQDFYSLASSGADVIIAALRQADARQDVKP